MSNCAYYDIEKCRVYKDCIYKDTDICHQCSREPGWKPRTDYFQSYEPACPIGMRDCVCDPAHIKKIDPDWYKELFGDMSIEEVVERECKSHIIKESNWCRAYDDEDK